MTGRAELAAIAADLRSIEDHLRWAMTQAWWPPSRALDAPRGRALPPLDPADPDRVPGPRHATGLGDHRAQQAIAACRGHLTTAESALRTVHAAHIARGDTRPRTVVRRLDPTPIQQVTVCAWFAATLHADLAEHLSPVERRLIGKARRAVDMALGSIAAALGDHKPVDEVRLPAKHRCAICGIRPRAPKKGKRCSTCANWRDRHGYERPRRLDSTADAKAAQARRRARGEGWGDESLSGTSSPPIHDCTCTPDERCDRHDRPGPSPVECGTPQGYLAHRRNNEAPCDRCTEAWIIERENIRSMIRTRHLGAS